MTKLTLETAAAQVQTVLSANTEIVDVVTVQNRNEKGHLLPKTTTFTVKGAGVSTPFNRHYLKNRKLPRLALDGFVVTLTTPRKSGVTLVTVAPAPKATKPAPAQVETQETAAA